VSPSDEVNGRGFEGHLHRNARREGQRRDGGTRDERRQRHAAVDADAPEGAERRDAHDPARQAVVRARRAGGRGAPAGGDLGAGARPPRPRPGPPPPPGPPRPGPPPPVIPPPVRAATHPGKRFSTPTKRATASLAGAPNTRSGGPSSASRPSSRT